MDRAAITINRYLENTTGGEVIILTDSRGEVTPFDWIGAYAQSDAVRVTPADTGLIIPEGPMCYMLGPQVPNTELEPVTGQVTAVPTMTVPATPPWSFHCGDARPSPPAPIASWENGMHLLSSEVDGTFAPAESLHLTYRWHYLPDKRREYHIFNHLVLEDQTLVAQMDGAGVPTKYWRSGDVLITYFELHVPNDLPEGDYHLVTGTYTWPEIERTVLTDGSSNYLVERFTLP
jgi:hypothetical protein